MRRRRRSRGAWLWWCLIIAALVFVARAAVLMLYPFPYRNSVQTWAKAYGVDPYLVAAVIRVESRWQPTATSRKGAIGLMQVMPDTANWIASQAKLPAVQPQDLYDPDLNIRLGTWYLAKLTDDFDGRVVLALAAYNGGGNNVREWLRTNQWDGQHYTTQQIPFPETRRYVDRVMTDYRRYQLLYEHR